MKRFYNNFKWYNWLIYCSIIVFYLFLVYKWGYTFFITLGLILVLYIFFLFHKIRFLKLSVGNGIIYGGRGKGKGLLLQCKANSFKKVFSNVPFGSHCIEFNLKEYCESIGDNTIFNAIEGDIKVIEKIEKFEGINILVDDISVYAPNFEDNKLKKLYPQLPLILAVNRHLYNHYMIISVQDRNRPYKILRELQTDFSIKALGSYGWGWFWRSIPILRFYCLTKYRYYEEVKSAENGLLPFKAVGAVNEVAKTAYLTSGQATKEVFKAQNGIIKEGLVLQRKSKLKYDTRYFHKVFYGKTAN